MIPREVIDEIVRRNDITAVIGTYVNLKRAGSNYAGLCPFHSEKSPSFTVFPGTNSFYCFGCGAGGNVITFVQKYENLSYPDAIRALADRSGISVPDDRNDSSSGPSRQRIIEMNTAAAKLYHSCLLNDPCAEDARQYLKSRQISQATIKHFYLGYAPDGFKWLWPQLKKLGFTEEEMAAGFLCGKKDGKIYDLYRARVMFPIVDTSKNIVAFGGRVLDDSKPKYLNTSDTPAFKKSRNLFALNYAKDSCQDYLILCEGYMDVIQMHQAGFVQAVATLGTAITEEHARIISKYTKKVILSYDSDGAGQKATDKAMAMLGNVGVTVRVLKMEGAKDPDEYIKKFGTEKFKNLLEGSRTGFEFRLESILAKYSGGDDASKVRAADELANVIAEYGSAVERDLYAARVCTELGISPGPFKEDIEKYKRRKYREQAQNYNREAADILQNYNDKVNPDAAKNVRAATAEETIIGLMLIYPEHRDAVADGSAGLEASDFFTSFGRRAFESIMGFHVTEGGFSFPLLGESFNPDEIGRLQKYQIERSKLSNNGRDALDAAVSILKDERRKSETKASGGMSLAEALLEKRRKVGEKK